MVKNRLADEKVINSENPETLHWSALSKYCAIGTEENEEEAFKLFEISAKKGYIPSQRAVAFCYKNGIGVQKDRMESLRWQTIAKIRSLNKIQLLATPVFFSILIFCFYITFFTTFVAEELLLKGYFNTSFYLFKILEKEDNPKSDYFLALYHVSAFGNLRQDSEDVKKYIDKIMNSKDPLATFSSAFFFQKEPEKQETIIKNTFDTVLKMAEDGNAFAQTEIGNLYYSGSNTVEKNPEKAFYWWSEAAKQGFISAKLNIALCYQYGTGIMKDEEKALDIYKELATSMNYIVAKRNLANYYFEKDNGRLSADACYWYEQAALQGDIDAQNKLGICYNIGYENWKARNEFESCKWYEKAASQGHPEAQFNIGRCYFNGTGVNQKDPQKACEWLEKAAIKGLANAQNGIGLCYYDGNGREKDPQKGCEWFEKAAIQGMPEAQHHIGRCYYEGNGVKKDPKKGCEWFEKAAIYGLPVSQYVLGLCYYIDGFEKNDEKAKFWLRKAASQKNMDAINMLREAFNEKVDLEEIESK